MLRNGVIYLWGKSKTFNISCIKKENLFEKQYERKYAKNIVFAICYHEKFVKRTQKEMKDLSLKTFFLDILRMVTNF